MMHFPPDGSSNRRGVVLLVVIALLTLFAVLGLSFVLYANATAEGSRLHREAQTERRPDVDPELLFSLFLGQLLYDAPDDQTGVFSGLRGHSLARGMFGLNYDLQELATPQAIAARNSVPFNGTGRLRVPLPALPGGPDDYHLVNYTYFRQDPFLRDPERPGVRRGGVPDLLQWDRARFNGGYNAPYTYPDLNNMFLAAVKADGTVMLPSFHRPWTGFGDLWTGNVPNPKWFATGPGTELFKYMTLRPRPAEHLGFPPPADAGGDVKNLAGYPGGNDSIWLDLDAPVMTAPDGRKYKALFAPLIMDLDNRVNLNVHGNARGVQMAGQRIEHRRHASNQGWGAWEVNPSHLGAPINDPNARLTDKQREWVNMVTGTSAPAQRGRLSMAGPPYGGPVSLPGVLGRIYSPVDLDGANEVTGLASEATRPPGILPSLPWQCFPSVPTGYGNGSATEYRDHPALANPFLPTAGSHVFPLSNVEALLRYSDTGSPALTSELFRLAPLNFGDRNDPESIRRRNLVTVHSCDIDRPGVMPFYWSHPLFTTRHQYRLAEGAMTPSGRRIPFRMPGQTVPDLHLLPDSEFGRDWRAATAVTALRRMDLNRYLPRFPAPNPQTGIITDIVGAKVALRARQYMAADIFERLCRATGAGSPSTVAPPGAFIGHDPERWRAFRWLAQLAANMVDFIDADDYHTPFQWDKRGPLGEWVYGTELPRLVINEVYGEYDNHGLPGGVIQPVGNPPYAGTYAASVWVELHNPLASDNSLTDQGAAVLHNGTFPIYQLIISPPGQRLRAFDNVRGNLDSAHRVVQQFGPGQPRVLPCNGQFFDRNRQNLGFFVIGADLMTKPILRQGTPVPQLPVTFPTRELTYFPPAAHGTPKPTIILRRLTCPHLRPNSPDIPFPAFNPDEPFNPYLTVDYMEDVSFADGRTLGAQGEDVPIPMLMGLRQSQGRAQPFAADGSQRRAQAPKPPPPVDGPMPQNSFFQQNVDERTGEPNWPNTLPPPGGYLPFDWLVHLDRPLISPMELLHVSAYKPHELTQMFVTGDLDGDKSKHRAPWFDDDPRVLLPDKSHRLWRVFEFFTTRPLSVGMGEALTWNGDLLKGTPVPSPPPNSQLLLNGPLFGKTSTGGTWQIDVGSVVIIDRGKPTEEVVRVTGVFPPLDPIGIVADFLRPHLPDCTVQPAIVSDRIPGKINLNTVWDYETFLAMCDPQLANDFTEPDIRMIYEKMISQRTPTGIPAENDKPFLGMAVGNSAEPSDVYYTPNSALFRNGSGLNDTLLRSDDVEGAMRSPPRLFRAPSATYPYSEHQLLHKIFNQMTSRSNVFAVWLTVGFFEVKDEASRPVKLGPELVLASGNTVRHRMFAVVDRSVMTANPGPQPRFRLSTNPANPWTTGLVVPYYSIIQ